MVFLAAWTRINSRCSHDCLYYTGTLEVASQKDEICKGEQYKANERRILMAPETWTRSASHSPHTIKIIFDYLSNGPTTGLSFRMKQYGPRIISKHGTWSS